jgi:hypothetical protein
MFLVIVFLITSSVALATDNHVVNFSDIQSLSKISIDLSSIPIYITVSDNIELVKEAAETIDYGDLDNKEETKNYILNYQGSDFEIKELSALEKEEIIKNPLFSNTLLRVQEMVEEGKKVNYINFFMKQAYQTYSGDPDDIEYWESSCEYLGSYDGYKFLFLESSVGVESDQVEPDNISPSIDWTELAITSFETFISYKVKGVLDSVLSFIGTLADFFETVDPPVKITYGESDGYLKFKVSGDLYMRTIFIRDDHDRVPGYAYYAWGHTEQARMNTILEAKWPTEERPGGTYNYDVESFVYPKRTTSTPGFYGNSTLYRSIIDLYNNEIGYFTHDEEIDVNSLVVDMIINPN